MKYSTFLVYVGWFFNNIYEIAQYILEIEIKEQILELISKI